MNSPLPEALSGLGVGIFSDEDLLVYSRYMKDLQPIDWSHPVLLVIDASMAFLGPNLPTVEASAALRTACGRPAWEALTRIKSLIEAFRNVRGQVVYTIPDRENEAHYGSMKLRAVRANVDRLADGLEPAADELLLRKPKASAFFGTALPILLTRGKASVIVLAGGTTSGCVRASAVDASSFGWDVVLAVDACFDRSDISHRVSAFEIGAKYARLLDTDEVAAELRPTDR